MLDLNGKKLGRGEFTQEMQGKLLHIQISYDLDNGHQIVEKASFQQRPELAQKEWSWQEHDGGTLVRRYAIDFDSGKAAAEKREKNGLRRWSEQVKIEPGQKILPASVSRWPCRICAIGCIKAKRSR